MSRDARDDECDGQRLQSYSQLHRILRLTNRQLTRLRFINILNKTADIAFQTETDPSAPHKQSDQAPRWTAPVADLLSAGFALSIAALVWDFRILFYYANNLFKSC